MASYVVPSEVPDAAEDAKHLCKATKKSTDKDTIISILAHRNVDQRTAIRDIYFEMYGIYFIDALVKNISGEFGILIFMWLLRQSERDAIWIHEALFSKDVDDWISNYQILVEIACSRSLVELISMKDFYNKFAKKSIEEDVERHTKGDIQKLLLLLVSCYRYSGDNVNSSIAMQDAEILHEKIIKKRYNSKKIFNILALRSKAHLKKTIDLYKEFFSSDILKDLGHGDNDDNDRNNDRNFYKLLITAIKCLLDPVDYFENILEESIKDENNKDVKTLTRVIVTRAEVDLKSIMELYHKKKGIHLEHAFDRTLDYDKMILELLGTEGILQK